MKAQEQQPQVTKQSIWMIWGALLMSQLVFCGVGHFKIFPTVPEGMKINVLIIMASIAVVLLFVSHIFFRKGKNLLSESNQSHDVDISQMQQAFTFLVAGWGLGEAVTIMGLILPIIGGVGLIEYSYMFFSMGIGFHIYRRPY